ncbi:hypothetical protein ACOMHN_059263 [Nucella lapillus]
MAAVSKTISLPGTGDKIPVVAYGTWTVFQNKPGEVFNCVKAAIDAGYRHIDCAWVYDTEGEVGQAVSEKIKDGTITRKDVFITTKIWDTYHAKDRVKLNLEKSLAKLQMSYVDLLLVHWPTCLKDGDNNFPQGPDGKCAFVQHDLKDTWKGMEECVNAKLTRNIGFANFNSKQIQRILDCATIKPCNLQVEVNPTMANTKLIDFARSKNIVVSAYAPLGAPGRPWKQRTDPCAMEDPVIKGIADKKGKSPAQVILRWHLQRGLCLCVKSLNPDRIHENLDVFNFELTAEEVGKINGLNKNFRLYTQDMSAGHPEYPFKIEF